MRKTATNLSKVHMCLSRNNFVPYKLSEVIYDLIRHHTNYISNIKYVCIHTHAIRAPIYTYIFVLCESRYSKVCLSLHNRKETRLNRFVYIKITTLVIMITINNNDIRNTVPACHSILYNS